MCDVNGFPNVSFVTQHHLFGTTTLQRRKCFEDEKALVTFEAPVKIFGDLHGQYVDLLHMFKEMGDKNKND